MSEQIHLKVVDRRSFVLGASAAAALAALAPLGASPVSAKAWKDIMKESLAGATEDKGKVKVDLPEIAENGNTVPYKVNVESPMTDADYIKSIHVFATGNPGPRIIDAHFTPLSGKAYVKGRMRLAKTQEVIVVAHTSTGKAYLSKTTVKVTIGGCGG